MATITWNTDVSAPCAGEILSEDGRSVLVQSDWDYPGTASSFGWTTRNVQKCRRTETDEETGDQRGFAVGDCRHSHTDGTVDCPDCGVTVAEFLESAREWLDNHDGATADDPGYFTEN